LQQPLCFACPEALKPVNWLVRPLFFPNSVILLNISMKIDGFVKSQLHRGILKMNVQHRITMLLLASNYSRIESL